MKHIKRKRMKIIQERFPLRNDLEHCVWAFNSILKDEVQFMTLTQLLNNVHPLYRVDYARQLHKLEKITDDELTIYVKERKKEFVPNL